MVQAENLLAGSKSVQHSGRYSEITYKDKSIL